MDWIRPDFTPLSDNILQHTEFGSPTARNIRLRNIEGFLDKKKNRSEKNYGQGAAGEGCVTSPQPRPPPHHYWPQVYSLRPTAWKPSQETLPGIPGLSRKYH